MPAAAGRAGFPRLGCGLFPFALGFFPFFFLSGCSAEHPAANERLAILPFENLTADPSLDWMGRATQEVLTSDLSDAFAPRPFRLAHRREAPATAATHVLHGRFEIRGNRLRLAASLEDLRTSRMTRTLAADGLLSAGLVPLANALARQIGVKARPYGTRSEQALEAFAKALAAVEPAASATEFERAVSADPDFGDAYVAWVESLAARGDLTGAQRVLSLAAARGTRIHEVSRDRLSLIDASLRGDSQSKLKALAAMARKTPGDVQARRSLARAEFEAHNFEAAAGAHRRVVALDAGNPLAWNELGYAETFARNLDGAVKAFREYERLAPGEANPLDSLGDAYFYFGRFPEAEKSYFETHRKNPRFLQGGSLYKAARARLMTGDIDGAGRLFRQFADARQASKDQLLPYREAQWLYLTGQRRRAVQAMASLASATALPEAAALAHSQLAVWMLGAGDERQARDHARLAKEKALSPPTRALAALCDFLAQPSAAPAEVQARASAAFPSDQSRNPALGLKLLLGRHYAEALTPLQDARRRSNPASGEPYALLVAWALAATGRYAEALPLLETHGIPQPGVESIFFSLAFPRSLLLRATALETLKRPAEAKPWRALYDRLSSR
jgi:tetratricopeptide (TPR) repeat protein